jgi:hypothetical protein
MGEFLDKQGSQREPDLNRLESGKKWKSGACQAHRGTNIKMRGQSGADLAG